MTEPLTDEIAIASAAAAGQEQAAPPSPDRSRARLVIVIVSWCVFAATLAGFTGGISWILGLFSPFRFQLLLASIALLIALPILRWRCGWRVFSPLVAVAISAAINAMLVAPLWMSIDRTASGPAITIMALNLHHGNGLLDEATTARPIGRFLAASGAEILIVQEITVHRLGILASVLPEYRLACGTGRPDAFGIALFVRRSAEQGGAAAKLRIESAREIDVTQGIVTAKQVELRCRWQGRPLSVLGMHTISAVHAKSDRYRAAMLASAATWATLQRGEQRAVIFCGDFNATPWCGPFARMLAESGLVNSQRGFGLQGSWPLFLPGPLRLPIDQCVHSDDLVTIDRQVTPAELDTDHLPLTVKLQWR